jgi:murein peptide amidase A
MKKWRLPRKKWALFAMLSIALNSGVALAQANPTPGEIPKICFTLEQRLPNLPRGLCAAAQLRPSGAASVKQQPLYVRDVAVPVPKLRVLVVGGIHGDELSSTSLAFHWLRLATTGSDGASPAILSDTSWRFIPALNPDGLLSQPPTRMNARGVDLNRNFPTPNWDKEAKIYWEGRTKRDPRRYPGPKPLSEPESQFLHDQMRSFKPHAIVAIHAPYGMLDFDGPNVPPSKLGRLYLDQIGIFPGSLGNYGGVHRGMPVVTIELPSAFRTPQDAEMRQMWLDMLRWLSERVMPRPPVADAAKPLDATKP